MAVPGCSDNYNPRDLRSAPQLTTTFADEPSMPESPPTPPPPPQKTEREGCVCGGGGGGLGGEGEKVGLSLANRYRVSRICAVGLWFWARLYYCSFATVQPKRRSAVPTYFFLLPPTPQAETVSLESLFCFVLPAKKDNSTAKLVRPRLISLSFCDLNNRHFS